MLVIDTNVWISYLLITPSTFGQKLDQVLKQDAYAFSEATFTELTEDEDLLCLDPFRNIRITTVASFQLDSI